MYTHYFKLKQSPFSIAPDPRYLFMSERHREALAHLLYGVGSGGGFVLLTGEIGAGKTTVCRCFIEQIPENCRLAYIFNPKLTVEELLLSICDEFRIALPLGASGPAGAKSYVDAINRCLLESHGQGKNNVLIIDEAQNLSADVLEQLRLLTNLETNERKLLQIILIGQPELRTLLARPELEQLAQRVIARYHLGSLSEEDTGSYVAHRLAVAGATAITPFPSRLMPRIYRLSKGIPRRINLLCDRALLGAYVENAQEVTRTILDKAAGEVFADHAAPAEGKRRQWAQVAAGVAAGVAIICVLFWPTAARVPAAVPAARAATAALGAPLSTPGADQALRQLAALWGGVLPAGEPCEAALALNLRCYQGKGALYDLRLLDRPAILTLHDGPNVSYGVLARLDDVTATLVRDGRQQAYPVAALAARFDGEFTTFWSLPRAFRERVGAGDRGPDVDWIAAHMATLNGAPPPPANAPLGQLTRERLRAFQAKHRLKPDGVAGPRTFMRLNQLDGAAEPHLLARAKAGK